MADKSILFGIIVMAMFIASASAISGSLPKMPSGPEGPGRFGAYYTTLAYDEAWDAPWRIGPHADVVVRFDTGGHKFVFWRGTSYIPCWVTDTGIWYTNEFVERSGADCPNTQGCCEPMSDKQCRYSQVRIIEHTDARVVIHWRYAPVDVHYNHPFIDPETGWSDWVDEYYSLYPDATGVRKITVHTSAPDKWMEWHEAIVLNQPGTMPEDNIELGALSVANMKGESKTYVWTEAGSPSFHDQPVNSNILKVNLKAEQSPFAIIPPNHEARGRVVTPFRGHGEGSFFNFWDHWPVSTDASDGRLATSSARPSHSSLAHIAHQRDDLWPFFEKGEKRRTKIMLHGMTRLDAAGLVSLAKSWVNAPVLKLNSDGYEYAGFEQAERAYHLVKTGDDTVEALSFQLLASPDHPVINPAFVVRHWGERDVVLKLDGEAVERGRAFRYGHRHTLDGTDLIVWLEIESQKELSIEFMKKQ